MLRANLWPLQNSATVMVECRAHRVRLATLRSRQRRAPQQLRLGVLRKQVCGCRSDRRERQMIQGVVQLAG